ncbi:MAG TPA: long-chain fatty acid--CoA ligase [Pyrinomonadaceae bacterium]|nr:long-chain fatty acid--CoA ligase [Pyrinomonadaceae bacterium]
MTPITQTPTTELHVAQAERVPLSPDEPTTLVEVFEYAVRAHNRADAVNYKQNGRWVSVSSDELLARIHCVAAGIHSLGISSGDRVAILSESRLEWTLSDAGCQFAGAIDVPIYPTLTPTQVGYILKDSGARVLIIVNEAKFTEVRDVVLGCTSLEHIVFIETPSTDLTFELGRANVPSLSLNDLEEKGRQKISEDAGLIDRLTSQISPDDLATFIYTSGTTGEPKGVMLAHSNLVSNLVDSSAHFSFENDDSALSVLPLSHVLERVAMYMYIYHGMAVYFGESLEMIGPNLREVRPTIFVGVPRIFEKILARVKEKTAEKGKLNVAILDWAITVAKEQAKLSVRHQKIPALLALKHKLADKLIFSKMRTALGGRIRLLISGGAALPEELGYIYIGAGLPIVQGYGLTETSPVITAARLDDNRVGTVGKAIPNVEVRIASDGEIETRGPHVMRGYYNKPAETAAVMSPDGWFKTGDIGTLDEDGFLRITDRKKELFKTSGGKYIAPQPIEQMIKGSQFVSQVVLIGNGRRFAAALIVPDWERVDAYVQLKGLKPGTRAELCQNPRIIDLFQRQVASLTTELPQYESVKKVALLEHEMTIDGGELTPTMKVKRRVVDEKYRNVIDALYADPDVHNTAT